MSFENKCWELARKIKGKTKVSIGPAGCSVDFQDEELNEKLEKAGKKTCGWSIKVRVIH